VQGFAESYMLGEVSSPDLTKFFEVRGHVATIEAC